MSRRVGEVGIPGPEYRVQNTDSGELFPPIMCQPQEVPPVDKMQIHLHVTVAERI